MKNRRDFLKIAGVAAAGLAALPAVKVLAEGAKEMQALGALHAKRWGMAIDTAKLKDEDFKAIIEACHSLHNVPDKSVSPIERVRKQDMKWVWTDDYEHSFPDDMNKLQSHDIEHRKFLLLCNHCENPPCVRVCPTKATFKTPDGITMMDMHRCIGCRFCMAACPYGARSFNFCDPRLFLKKENREYPTRMRGVVEKCTFCEERLAVGKLPACVEASKGGILFGDLDDPNSDVRKALASRFSIRRKPNLGTQPGVYYLI